MNLNNGLIFLAAAFGIVATFTWIGVGVYVVLTQLSSKWLWIPTAITVLTIILGFLATSGVGR